MVGEGVTPPRWILLDSVEGDSRVENLFIEGDEPIHVAGEEGHVVEVVAEIGRL
jgi:hypothetical protein